MTNGILVLTALPPTRGHRYLVDFASRYMQECDPSGKLHVIVCSRPGEPIDGVLRATAFGDAFASRANVWVHHRDANDPNLPDEHPRFWDFWRDIVRSKVNHIRPDDILFASDDYGIEFARQLGCRFQPCDPQRTIVRTQASRIRENPMTNFDDMMPEFARGLTAKVTFFGAESTGKTTMSRRIAEKMNANWCHEWARPYLEMCGPETTDERMTDIVMGQYAAMRAVAALPPRAFTIHDTDLLSTLGYYRIYGGKPDQRIALLAERTRSDFYIVMNSAIPFTPDRLRYGGDKRESGDQFWIDLLEEHGREYHVVRDTSPEGQFIEIVDVLRQLWLKRAGWAGYER